MFVGSDFQASLHSPWRCANTSRSLRPLLWPCIENITIGRIIFQHFSFNQMFEFTYVNCGDRACSSGPRVFVKIFSMWALCLFQGCKGEAPLRNQPVNSLVKRSQNVRGAVSVCGGSSTAGFETPSATSTNCTKTVFAFLLDVNETGVNSLPR